MANIAIFAREGARHGALAAIARASGVVVDGARDLPALLRLLGHPIDIVLAEGLSVDDLAALTDDTVRVIVLADEADAADLALAGASAILPRDASAETIAAAIALVGQGLRVLPDLAFRSLTDVETASPPNEVPALTPREREVLAAMADGASNKVIARRLGISFHTAKFHVASILTKLDADTRTEALARAARMGLVML
jgi:DNA-binding NarL/FixJ family response regulator